MSMEESQTESIDISSIKAAALARPQPQAVFEEVSSDRLQATRAAFHQLKSVLNPSELRSDYPQAEATTSQSLIATQSLLDLPSTVPDSQVIINVEQNLEEIPNASAQQQAARRGKKMSSQGAPHDTQPLSPAFLETLKKSKQTQVDEETANTHGTLHPGDEGYVDFGSSIAQDGASFDDEDEPVEVEFSPTQSVPSRLSQFPESQRFKTPATVSRKRNYNGDTIESPALPRNPFARRGDATPGKGMGLSQAFLATQAPSSPFVNGMNSGPRSDRPSPTFVPQAQVDTATKSSPSRLHSIPRRPNGPQTRYVSMDESQKKRDARLMELHNLDEEEDSDDSFDETPLSTRTRRKEKQRNEEAQRQFDAFATTPRALPSAPIRISPAQLTHSSPAAPRSTSELPSDNRSPLALPNDGIPNESEDETDQEDQDEVTARLSNQIYPRVVPEEDKENAPQGTVQIPATIALHRMMTGYNSEVEVSPSVRFGNVNGMSHPGSQRLEERETFIIANSQSSQIRQHPFNASKLASSGEQSDFVPQSQYPAEDFPQEATQLGILNEEGDGNPNRHDTFTLGGLHPSKSTEFCIIKAAELKRSVTREQDDEGVDGPEAEDEEPPRRNLRSQALARNLPNTIPETNSAQRKGDKSGTEWHGEISKSTSEFETAPTHFPTLPVEHDSAPATLPSQRTVVFGQADGKRKRMTEIDAEESQPRSTGPDLGEIDNMLIDPAYRDIMGSSSPLRSSQRTKKRRLEGSPLKKRQHALIAPSTCNGDHDEISNVRQDEQEPAATQGDIEPTVPDDIPTSPPRRAGLQRPTVSRSSRIVKKVTYGKTNRKFTGWDVQMSPEKSGKLVSAPPTTRLRNSSMMPQTSMPSLASPSPLPSTTRQQLVVNGKQDIVRAATASHEPPTNSRLQAGEVAASAAAAVTDRGSVSTNGPDGQPTTLGEIIAPNQVLACYNGKSRAYYPATCIGMSGAETLRYQIQWDGHEPDEVDEHGVRSLDLRYGDNIKVDLYGFSKTPHIIRGFKDKIGKNEKAVTDVRGYKTLLVVQRQRKSLPSDASVDPEEIKEVPVSTIYLDSNMWNQMRNRPTAYAASITLPSTIRPGFSTPLDRPSTPSTPSSRHRRHATTTAMLKGAPIASGTGILASMAFAISYESESRRNELAHVITSNGGVVLESGFQELFQLETLTLKQRYTSVGFTALLADKHSTKVKYLQALALGLPCLSGKWVETCTANDCLVDWQSYLLPAGESKELEGAVKSRILPIYDPISSPVADVVKSRPDVLTSDAVILVLGRGKGEEKRRPYVFLAQALGAGHIQQVADLEAAKSVLHEPEGMLYKWVFVDDSDVKQAQKLLTETNRRGVVKAAGLRIVGNEFVKQSLVLGRKFGGQ